MQYLNFQKQLKVLWQKAVDAYSEGKRGASTYFSEGEAAYLASIGQTPQEIYDFAEDWVSSNEPDFETYLLVSFQRYLHFSQSLNSLPSGKIIDTPDLPAKSEEVAGIVWLPRIIEKAKAKLNGEMSDDLMYGCGGDRRFFKTNNIHPAEFLAIVRSNLNDDKAVIDWVVTRSNSSSS